MTPQEAKEILISHQIQIKFSDNTPKYEKDLYQAFINGLAENKISKIYTFIEALERDNYFYFDKKLHKFLDNIFNEYPQILLQHFKSEIDFVNICFLFRSCTPVIIKYVALNTRENGLLIYEALRQIYLHTKNTNNEYIDVIEIMNHLAEIDVDKLTYFINKHQYSLSKEPFFLTLLQRATETLLLHLFTNIDIEYANNKIDFGKCISSQSEERHATFISKICPIIITKWNQRCEEQKKNATILSSLHITQYFNLICISFDQTYNSKEIESLLEEALNIFFDNLHRWYETSSKFLVYYFINLTQIYIMLAIIKNNNYTLSNELKIKLDVLKNILNKTKSFWRNDADSQFDLLLELSHIV